MQAQGVPVLLLDIEHEIEQTRRMLQAVPEDRFGWQPHAKSFTLGKLAAHVGNLVHWPVMTLQTDHLDLATMPPPGQVPSKAEILASLESNAAQLKTLLPQVDDAVLAEPWQLRHGAHVLLEQPKGMILRSMCVNHMIHHRGQLAVYLRLLDVPVPGLYGPSADEK